MSIWGLENDRNLNNSELFKAMLTEAYPDVELVVSGHHILYRRTGASQHEEIPSADALIFDHTIAQAVWGSRWKEILAVLAQEPAESRDSALKALYDARNAKNT